MVCARVRSPGAGAPTGAASLPCWCATTIHAHNMTMQTQHVSVHWATYLLLLLEAPFFTGLLVALGFLTFTPRVSATHIAIGRPLTFILTCLLSRRRYRKSAG